MSAKNIKSTWSVASLVMAGLLLLTGCATSSADATNNTASNTECVAVNAALEEANASLETAKASLKESEGTPAEADAKAAVADADTTITALNTRATECEVEDGKGAPTVSNGACETQFKQVTVDRVNSYKVDPRYDALARPIKDNKNMSAEEKSNALRDVDLKLAASNAQTLAFWAYALKLYDDPNNWKPLVEGGEIKDGACLSAKGQVLFAKYEGAVSAQGVSYTTADAPQGGINSGINGDTAVIDESFGIRTDRSSVVITLADGSKMIRLIICGNIVFPKAPNLPKGKTDPPPPEYQKFQTPTTQQDGWNQRGTDNGVTDGGESRRQQESGETRGNAVDDQVPNGTTSGGTTPDTKPSGGGGPVAPDATPGGDDQSAGVVDDANTNQDVGGTSGDTCVPIPDMGIPC